MCCRLVLKYLWCLVTFIRICTVLYLDPYLIQMLIKLLVLHPAESYSGPQPPQMTVTTFGDGRQMILVVTWYQWSVYQGSEWSLKINETEMSANIFDIGNSKTQNFEGVLQNSRERERNGGELMYRLTR